MSAKTIYSIQHSLLGNPLEIIEVGPLKSEREGISQLEIQKQNQFQQLGDEDSSSLCQKGTDMPCTIKRYFFQQ
jgi:hypothetical protein